MFQLYLAVRRLSMSSALWVNYNYLLWQFFLFQSDSQHMWQGFAALLVENVIHKWRALWQDLQAQRDAVYIIVCNWLLGQRRLAQVQNSDHYQHGLCNKRLRGTAKKRESRETDCWLNDIYWGVAFLWSKKRITYILFLFVLNNSNIAQGHFG